MWLSHLQFSLPFPPLPVSEYVTHVSIFLALINPIYLLSDKTPAYKNLSIQDFLSTFATSKFPAGACSPGWQWAASLLQPPPCCFINSKKKKKNHFDIQDLGANKLSWCYLGNITCCYPWQAYFFRCCSIRPLLHLGLSATPISTQREKLTQFLLLWIERESIQKRTFKERAFGITLPLSLRFYREIGYFEPLLVLCSVVICENYIKLSTQSDPSKNRSKCSIYNVLLQSSSATITVII